MISTILTAIFVSLAPAHGAEVVISKAQFLEALKSGLPGSFCAEKTYFRSCFPLSQADCSKAAGQAAAGCLDKLQAEMPAQFHQPADGQKWGEKVGACAGAKFEEDQAKVKAKSADCADPGKWKAPPNP